MPHTKPIGPVNSISTVPLGISVMYSCISPPQVPASAPSMHPTTAHQSPYPAMFLNVVTTCPSHCKSRRWADVPQKKRRLRGWRTVPRPGLEHGRKVAVHEVGVGWITVSLPPPCHSATRRSAFHKPWQVSSRLSQISARIFRQLAKNACSLSSRSFPCVPLQDRGASSKIS